MYDPEFAAMLAEQRVLMEEFRAEFAAMRSNLSKLQSNLGKFRSDIGEIKVLCTDAVDFVDDSEDPAVSLLDQSQYCVDISAKEPHNFVGDTKALVLEAAGSTLVVDKLGVDKVGSLSHTSDIIERRKYTISKIENSSASILEVQSPLNFPIQSSWWLQDGKFNYSVFVLSAHGCYGFVHVQGNNLVNYKRIFDAVLVGNGVNLNGWPPPGSSFESQFKFVLHLNFFTVRNSEVGAHKLFDELPTRAASSSSPYFCMGMSTSRGVISVRQAPSTNFCGYFDPGISVRNPFLTPTVTLASFCPTYLLGKFLMLTQGRLSFSPPKLSNYKALVYSGRRKVLIQFSATSSEFLQSGLPLQFMFSGVSGVSRNVAGNNIDRGLVLDNHDMSGVFSVESCGESDDINLLGSRLALHGVNFFGNVMVKWIIAVCEDALYISLDDYDLSGSICRVMVSDSSGMMFSSVSYGLFVRWTSSCLLKSWFTGKYNGDYRSVCFKYDWVACLDFVRELRASNLRHLHQAVKFITSTVKLDGVIEMLFGIQTKLRLFECDNYRCEFNYYGSLVLSNRHFFRCILWVQQQDQGYTVTAGIMRDLTDVEEGHQWDDPIMFKLCSENNRDKWPLSLLAYDGLCDPIGLTAGLINQNDFLVAIVKDCLKMAMNRVNFWQRRFANMSAMEQYLLIVKQSCTSEQNGYMVWFVSTILGGHAFFSVTNVMSSQERNVLTAGGIRLFDPGIEIWVWTLQVVGNVQFVQFYLSSSSAAKFMFCGTLLQYFEVFCTLHYIMAIPGLLPRLCHTCVSIYRRFTIQNSEYCAQGFQAYNTFNHIKDEEKLCHNSLKRISSSRLNSWCSTSGRKLGVNSFASTARSIFQMTSCDTIFTFFSILVIIDLRLPLYALYMSWVSSIGRPKRHNGATVDDVSAITTPSCNLGTSTFSRNLHSACRHLVNQSGSFFCVSEAISILGRSFMTFLLLVFVASEQTYTCNFLGPTSMHPYTSYEVVYVSHYTLFLWMSACIVGSFVLSYSIGLHSFWRISSQALDNVEELEKQMVVTSTDYMSYRSITTVLSLLSMVPSLPALPWGIWLFDPALFSSGPWLDNATFNRQDVLACPVYEVHGTRSSQLGIVTDHWQIRLESGGKAWDYHQHLLISIQYLDPRILVLSIVKPCWVKLSLFLPAIPAYQISILSVRPRLLFYSKQLWPYLYDPLIRGSNSYKSRRQYLLYGLQLCVTGGRKYWTTSFTAWMDEYLLDGPVEVTSSYQLSMNIGVASKWEHEMQVEAALHFSLSATLLYPAGQYSIARGKIRVVDGPISVESSLVWSKQIYMYDKVPMDRASSSMQYMSFKRGHVLSKLTECKGLPDVVLVGWNVMFSVAGATLLTFVWRIAWIGRLHGQSLDLPFILEDKDPFKGEGLSHTT